MPDPLYATPSVSMSRQLFDRFKQRYPRYGVRSKVIARMIEMLLDGHIQVSFPKPPPAGTSHPSALPAKSSSSAVAGS